MELPSVAVVDVKHHDSDVLVVIVVLLRLVHELRLHLDYAVEGLVGDQRLVPDVKLQEGCRPLQLKVILALIFEISNANIRERHF